MAKRWKRNPSFNFPAAGMQWHLRPAVAGEMMPGSLMQYDWQTREVTYQRGVPRVPLTMLLSIVIDQIWQQHIDRATDGAGLMPRLHQLSTAHLSATPRRTESNDVESAEPTGRVSPKPPTPERRRRW